MAAPALSIASGGTPTPDDSGEPPVAGQPEAASWRFALGVLLVAASAAGFAAAFRWGLAFALHHIAGTDNVVAAMNRAPLWARLVCPGLGGLLAGVLGMFVE